MSTFPQLNFTITQRVRRSLFLPFSKRGAASLKGEILLPTLLFYCQYKSLVFPRHNATSQTCRHFTDVALMSTLLHTESAYHYQTLSEIKLRRKSKTCEEGLSEYTVQRYLLLLLPLYLEERMCRTDYPAIIQMGKEGFMQCSLAALTVPDCMTKPPFLGPQLSWLGGKIDLRLAFGGRN